MVNKLRFYSNFVMVAIYISLGLLFLVTDVAIDTFPGYRKETGGIVKAAAIFIRDYLKELQEEDIEWCIQMVAETVLLNADTKNEMQIMDKTAAIPNLKPC